MKFRLSSRLAFPLAFALAALLTAPTAFAANQNWDGGGFFTGNWSNVDNWNGAVPGSTSATNNTNIATFNAAIETWGKVDFPVVIDSSTQNIGGISFTLAAGNYFIGSTGGNALRLTSGQTTQVLAALTSTNAIFNINAPLSIQAANGTYTFANNSANGAVAGAGTLNFGGGITGAVAGNTLLTLSGTNTNANTISGIIGNGTATTFRIVKSGAGSWVFTGGNTYTGSTIIGTAGSLASGGLLTVSGTAGTINASSSYAIHGVGSRLFLNNTAGNVDRLKDTGSAMTLNLGGELSLTGNGTTNTTETFTSLGFGTGYGIVTVSSAASRVTTLAATGALTRSNFSTGLLRGTSLNQSAATNVSRITLGAVPTGADFVGTNTLTGGAVADATQALKIIPWLMGDTAVAGNGTNFVTYDTTLGLRVLTNTEMTILVAGSTTAADPVNARAFNGTVTTPDLTVNSLLFNSASQTLNGSGALSVNSGAVAAVANTVAIGSGFSSLALGNGEGVLTATGTNVLTINAPINVSGASVLTKSGGGTVVFGASNLYTGQTTVNQGTLQIGTGTAGDLGSNTANIVLNGGSLSFGRTDAGLTIQNNISGTGGVTQSGTGTTTLTGTNTYSGTTAINTGVLLLGSTTALAGGIAHGGSGAALQMNGGMLGLGAAGDFTRLPNGSTVAAGRITFSSNGGFAAYGADRVVNFGGASGIVAIGSTATGNIGSLNGKTLVLGATTATHKVTVVNVLDFGAGTRPLQVDDGAADVDGEISGKIQPQAGATNVGLDKFGNGTLTLSGANTINGTLAIKAGQINVATIADSVSSNLGIGTSVVIGSGATTARLNYTGTGSSTARVVTIGSNSTTPVVGDTGGATILSSGANGGTGLKFTAANFNATGLTGSVASSRTLTLGGSNTDANAVEGIIADGLTGVMATAVDKTGDGSWTLSGDNTYSGATTVSDGTLYVTGALLNSSVTVNLNGAIGSDGEAGTLGNGLTIDAGGELDLTGAILGETSSGILGITGGMLSLGNLTFSDLVGWNWLAAEIGVYELIDGSFSINFGSTAYLDEASAFDFGNGKKGYFTGGSLKAVIIPEPSTALLGTIGVLALLRRRRC